MATKVKKQDRFNSFLDENVIINSAAQLKEEIKNYKKGNVGSLLGTLLIGSIATLLLSFGASVIGYGDPMSYFVAVIVTNFVSVIIHNIVFTCFLKRTRNERFSGNDVTFFMKRIIPQILCAIIVSVAQTMVGVMLLQVTSLIPMLNVVTSIVTSVLFTLLNALVAFRIFDNNTKVKDILPGAWNVIARNWKSLLFISLLFITWSYISNVAFSSMLYSQIQEVQGANNIFHALLQQQDYGNLLKVGGFYGLNYVIAGFLEIDILLGLALLYQRDCKVCFKEK